MSMRWTLNLSLEESQLAEGKLAGYLQEWPRFELGTANNRTNPASGQSGT